MIIGRKSFCLLAMIVAPALVGGVGACSRRAPPPPVERPLVLEVTRNSSSVRFEGFSVTLSGEEIDARFGGVERMEPVTIPGAKSVVVRVRRGATTTVLGEATCGSFRRVPATVTLQPISMQGVSPQVVALHTRITDGIGVRWWRFHPSSDHRVAFVCRVDSEPSWFDPLSMGRPSSDASGRVSMTIAGLDEGVHAIEHFDLVRTTAPWTLGRRSDPAPPRPRCRVRGIHGELAWEPPTGVDSSNADGNCEGYSR